MNQLDFVAAVVGHLLSWPVAIVVVAVIFRKSIRHVVKTLFAPGRQYKVRFASAEVVSEVVDRAHLPAAEQRLLRGSLTPHDIWALSSFAKGAEPHHRVAAMRPATRVAARLFAEYGLVRVVQLAGELWVEITPTGQAIVDAASTVDLPLTLGEANPSGQVTEDLRSVGTKPKS